MPAGRPPKPTALKRLHGTDRPDRANPAEPRPPVLVDVKPPTWLSGRGRKAWRELAPLLLEMGVLTVADRPALALLADAYGEYLELRGEVRRAGRVYMLDTKGGGAMRMPRPEVAMLSDAWRRTAKLLSEFGMTPSSRAKVSAVTNAEAADPFEEWLRGNERAAGR